MTAGLYVHVPFCLSKCRYCDFISFAGAEALWDAYIGAVVGEARARRTETVFTSLYIGGGTPTCLSASQLEQLIGALNALYLFSPDAEKTIECNPATADADKIRILKELGINRVSIGMQSNDDAILKALGRAHDYKQFLKTYELFRKFDFDNINIDIIYGLPGQTLKQMESVLDALIGLVPAHVSAYSLIVEAHTPLSFDVAKKRVTLPDEDTVADMAELAKDVLSQYGLKQYEVSNFAVPGRECRHNRIYWERRNYLGLGCAAHSLWDDVRTVNTSVLSDYINNKDRSGIYNIDKKDAIFERIMLALRLNAGLNKRDFEQEFGTDIYTIFNQPILKNSASGLIKDENGYIFATDRGMTILNRILLDFL